MASKYRKKFTIPENFQDFLAEYTREVLRDQPQDIVEFSYLYFKAMEEDTLDTFNYPRKGKNIPPPRDGQPDQEDYGQEEEGEQDDQLELFDENGNPRQFFDENG